MASRCSSQLTGQTPYGALFTDPPLVVLGNNPSNHTIQIALRTLSDTYDVNDSMVMAGTLLSVVPLLLAFVLFSRQMIAGAMEGAVKG